MLSLWESEDAVKAFAGEDVSVAVFHPEDERHLIERELSVSHLEVWIAGARSRPSRPAKTRT